MARVDKAIDEPFRLTAKRYTEVKKVIQRYFEEWAKTMGIDNWTFQLTFKSSLNRGNSTAYAAIWPAYCYQRAELAFYLPVLATEPDWSIERTVVHELVHCLVNPMENKKTSEDSLELVVTSLTRAFLDTKYGIGKFKIVTRDEPIKSDD